MPTPVPAARLCLSSDASSALDSAVLAASRRQHAQTTSLHVIFALLSSSTSSSSSQQSPLLRDALLRARSCAYSPRLQFKALELCFGIALDRLPSSTHSSSSSSSSSSPDEPPVSNSLMAAIKRSQANQRRHPDTFHFYQLQQQQLNSTSSSSSSFSGVKVELQQLILAILDDPVVSRVFGEAGFRSSDIKMAVLRPPPPPILRFPRSTRCPPLFLCNFAAAGAGLGAGARDDFGGDENCKKIGEIMGKRSNRNPMLVGVGAGDAARDFARSLERHNWGLVPNLVKYFDLEKEVVKLKRSGDFKLVKGMLDELVEEEEEEEGVVVGIGDLKGLVELDEEVLGRFVSEITRVLEVGKERVWVMGWSATYETYMKFLSSFPMLDKDWDLHLQLITSARTPSMGGLVTRAPSLMESFVPFGGFFPTAYESNVTVMRPYQSMPRCQHCNDKYQQELANILMECSPSAKDQHMANLPSWLRSVDTRNTNNQIKAKDDEKLRNDRAVDLEKKWNEYCQQSHQGFPSPEANKHPILPPIFGLPYVSDRDRALNINVINSIVTQSQSGFSSALPVTMGPQKITTATHISPPLVSEPANKDLISKLQVGPPKCEQLNSEELRPQSALTDLTTHEHLTSPPSASSVTTDLVLGTTRFEPLCTEELAHSSPSKNFTEFIQHQSHSSSLSQKLDTSDFKSVYSSLLEKLGRQEEAVFAISQAIIRRRFGHEMHRGTSPKGDLWLGFLGSDRLGKKKAAATLAELIFGSRENLISIDLGYQDRIVSRYSICDHCEITNGKANFRGKTVADYIAGEISKKPSSVVFLENVDKADFLVQERLLHAIRTGKFSDSNGREIGISNSIFVVTTDRVSGVTTDRVSGVTCSSPKSKTGSFSEEKILAAESWKMRILIESNRETTKRRRPNTNVLISSTREPVNRQVGRKRKLDAFLDLNLPLEEEVENDSDSSSSSNSDGCEEWVDKFLNSLDGNVNFKPFDFDGLSDYALKEISNRFCSIIGSEVSMEIDSLAMEEMLAASWLLEGTRDLNSWFDNVLLKSFIELKHRYSSKLSTQSVVRLVACEERFTEEHAPGVLLPCRILLD